MNSDMQMPILKNVTTDLELQKADARPRVDDLSLKKDSAVEQKKEENISEAELESAVTEMNAVAQNLQRDLLFSVDENSGGTFVKVVDKETEEVVREIPSKDIREIKARLEEVAGLIFQEKA